jgi:hypothetical protein
MGAEPGCLVRVLYTSRQRKKNQQWECRVVSIPLTGAGGSIGKADGELKRRSRGLMG